jgi:Peptidoglycan-synthase activator LpoB
MGRYCFLLLMIGLWPQEQRAHAQSVDSINILFQGLKASSYHEEGYRTSLEEKIKSQLISLHRFALIQRDSSFWKTLRNELEIKDFLNERTAIQLGNLAGANYYLEGKLIRIFTEQSKTPNSTQSTFIGTAEGSLTLVNLETGKYVAVLTSTQTGTADLPNSAIDMALQNLANSLVSQLKLKFPITVKINSLKAPYSVVLNKGFLDGIIMQQTFYPKSNRNLQLKVIEVLDHLATARLVTGNIQDLSKDDILVESTLNAENTVTVLSTQEQRVRIDGGENMGIKKGDLFVTEPITAEKRKPNFGIVFINKVNYDQAEGKVIQGGGLISSGISLKESKDGKYRRSRFLSLSYKRSFGISVKPNSNQGIVEVVNPLGNFSVNTKYHQNLTDIGSVSVVSIGLGTQNFIKKITTTLRADFFSIGSELNNWTANLDISYNHPLREQKLNLLVGGSFGYGRLKQYLPENVIEIISKGNSSYAYSYSFIGSAKTGLQLVVGQFNVVVSLSYDYLNYDDWNYSIKDTNNQEKQLNVPLSILNYSKVNLTGVYGELTLRYRLKN